MSKTVIIYVLLKHYVFTNLNKYKDLNVNGN